MSDDSNAARETSSEAAPLAWLPQARPGIVALPGAFDAPNTKLRVAVVDQTSFTRECIATSIRDLSRQNLSAAEDVEVEEFASCGEVPPTSRFAVLVYHLHGAQGEIPLDLSKIASFAPVIVLSADESPEAVRSAFDCGIRGYIPTATTGLDLLMQIVRFVNAGGSFVPPSILTPAATKPDDRQRLTQRELLILDLLKKGNQNKVIAYKLGMSQSTVKVHIRSILTKLRARNRTEAVSAALQSEASNAVKADIRSIANKIE